LLGKSVTLLLLSLKESSSFSLDFSSDDYFCRCLLFLPFFCLFCSLFEALLAFLIGLDLASLELDFSFFDFLADFLDF